VATTRARTRAIPWVRQLAKDHQALQKHAAGARTRSFDSAAPRLADSRFARELDAVLASADPSSGGLDLAVARGRRALMHERPVEALTWLMRAQSLATDHEPLLVGRIAFLLGAIHLGRDEEVATDAVLAWAEGILGAKADASADVLHLRALLAERRGEREAATALYRRVLGRGNVALTPMTRVLALRNLAATLAHAKPRESAGLYAMALATLDAEELDAATRSTIDNGMGYALLCSADIESARVKLHQAYAEAQRLGNERVQVYASFNLAIADELRGELAASAQRLAAIEAEARRLSLDELVGWTWIRRSWLLLRSGDRTKAAQTLRSALPAPVRSEHRDAVATLNALIQLPQRPNISRVELSQLAASYDDRGDTLTAFTLTLWAAFADAQGGRVGAARRAVAQACTLGEDHGFRLSTSWWAPELVALAREHASPGHAEFADRLISTGEASRVAERPNVLITRDGVVIISGREFAESDWREGKSGSGVLRRFFRVLLSAYPARLGRDELADLLWPESEGDKAIRNLYDATKDLRRVIARIPGARLEVTEGRYGLGLDANVTVR